MVIEWPKNVPVKCDRFHDQVPDDSQLHDVRYQQINEGCVVVVFAKLIYEVDEPCHEACQNWRQ